MSPNQALVPTTPLEVPETQPQGIPEDELHKILNELLDTYIDNKIDPERIKLYAQARKNFYYYHGMQWLVPREVNGNGIVDWRPIGNGSSQLSPTMKDSAPGTNAWVVNDFRGDVKKMVAVLSKAPNCIARPDWQSDTVGDKRSRTANEAAQYLYGQWPVDEINKQIVKSLALYGTTFVHNQWKADRNSYGVTKEPIVDLVMEKVGDDYWECWRCGEQTPGREGPEMVCGNCGNVLTGESFREAEKELVPKMMGEKEYANGCPEVVVASVSEFATPFYVKSLKGSPWGRYRYEMEAVEAVELFPGKGLEKELKDSGEKKQSDMEGERWREMAGAGDVLNPQTNGRDKWSYGKYWLRPMMLNYLYMMGLDEEKVKAVKEELGKKYSRGLVITRLKGTKIVLMEDGVLDEDWVAIKPEPSEFLYCDPHFQDYIQGAEMMNTAWCMEVELRLQSVPFTLFDQDRVDDSVFNRRITPGEYVPVVNDGGKMSDLFFRASAADPKPDSFEYITTLRNVFREIVGIMPAIFGGEDISGQTAEESRRKLNQALQVLAIVWSGIRSGWVDIYTNSVLKLARYSNETVYKSLGSEDSASGRKIAGLRDLTNGGYHFECDQSIPMAWTQLKDFVQSLFVSSPEYADALGARKTGNLSKLAEGIGMTGWKIPGMEERSRILGVIDKLKQGVPEMDPMTGMLIPSIPFDSFTHDSMLAVEITKEWLQGPDAIELEGTPYYQNVLAWGQAAMATIPPMGPDGMPLPPDPNQPPPPPPAIPAGMPPPAEGMEVAPAPEQELTSLPPDEESLAMDEMV